MWEERTCPWSMARVLGERTPRKPPDGPSLGDCISDMPRGSHDKRMDGQLGTQACLRAGCRENKAGCRKTRGAALLLGCRGCHNQVPWTGGLNSRRVFSPPWLGL